MSRTTNNRRKRLNRRDLCGCIPRRVKRWFKYQNQYQEWASFLMPMHVPEFVENVAWKFSIDTRPAFIAPRCIVRNTV